MPVSALPESNWPEPAENCQPCHQRIYDEWRQSSMANSVKVSGWCLDSTHNGLASNQQGDAVGWLCYSCHAPTAYLQDHIPYQESDAKQGINCDVCHSIASVTVTPRLDPSEIEFVPGAKRGTRTDIVDSPHPVEYSELHGTSEFCAACHHWVWPENGLPVDWTYGQWLDSPQAAEGITCQDCHMRPREGKLAEVEAAPERNDVASHTFHGSRHLPSLRSALRLDLRVRPRKQDLLASVLVANIGAGHSIPGGGGALRQLELRVLGYTKDGQQVYSKRQPYQLRYYDAQGRLASGSSPLAVRFVDTSIRAGERRVERVALPADAEAASVVAELWFWYVAPDTQARSGLELDSKLAGPVKLHALKVQVPAPSEAR